MRFWFWSIVASGLIVTGCLGAYFYNFHEGWSSDQSDWGSFGGFISGVATPLISLLALIAFLQGLRMQQAEWRSTKVALEEQSFEGMFFKLVDNYYRSVDLLRATISRTSTGGLYRFTPPSAHAKDSNGGRGVLVKLAEHYRVVVKKNWCYGVPISGDENGNIVVKSLDETVRAQFKSEYKAMQKTIQLELGSYFSSIFLLVNHLERAPNNPKLVEAYVSILKELLQEEDKIILTVRCLGVESLSTPESALCRSGILDEFLANNLHDYNGLNVASELSQKSAMM